MSLTMKKKKPNQQNLLTMIPVLKDRYQLERNKEKAVTRLIIPRDNFVERLSIRYFNQPASIKVRLDSLGDFVMSRCNGKWTVRDIADGLEQEFEEAANPVLPRLVKFLQMVEANGWIVWKQVH